MTDDTRDVISDAAIARLAGGGEVITTQVRSFTHEDMLYIGLSDEGWLQLANILQMGNSDAKAFARAVAIHAGLVPREKVDE